MTYEEFCDLVSFLYKSNLDKDIYINSIPRDLSSFIFDNSFSNILEKQNQKLMQFYFQDLYHDVDWFLYEWSPNSCNEITVNNKSYIIKSLDDYLDYAKQELFF